MYMKEKNSEQVPSSAELLKQIKAQMSETMPWPERFARLAQDIADVADSVACQQCQENLDLLVSDELAAHDIQQKYPDLLAHIAACQDCAATYHLLKDTLSAGQETDQAFASCPSISTSERVVSDNRQPWQYKLGHSPAPFPLSFQVAREFIAKALRGPQLAFVRGETSERIEHGNLLFAEVIPTPQGDLFMEAVIDRHIEDRQAIDLHVFLVSNWVFPDNLRVNLFWGDIRLSETMTASGQVSFCDLPLDDLTETALDRITSDLILDFVCG
jgi:hypothetical protein